MVCVTGRERTHGDQDEAVGLVEPDDRLLVGGQREQGRCLADWADAVVRPGLEGGGAGGGGEQVRGEAPQPPLRRLHPCWAGELAAAAE